MKCNLIFISTLLLAGLFAGCSSTPNSDSNATVNGSKSAKSKTPTRKSTAVLKRGGGFYKDDGPADDIPDGLDDIADAEPRWEPLHKPATRPYNVLGKNYVPNTTIKPYKARGIASWYGKKFHGQKTSIGEPYDMFSMTAAHTTLALPSYVKVTQLETGKSVIVRVIDRGPFHEGRIIDLSYTAAYKLGLINGGSGMVEVEAIIPGSATTTSYDQITTSIPPKDDDITLIAKRTVFESPPPSEKLPPINAAAPRGTYLQLGAFSNAENAENLRQRLSQELDWVNEALRIFTAGNIHRLQLGPYPSRQDAEQIAGKIKDALGYKPTIVNR